MDDLSFYDSLIDVFDRAKIKYERNSSGRTIHLYYNQQATVATAFLNYRHAMSSDGDVERAKILLVDKLNKFLSWVGQQVS